MACSEYLDATATLAALGSALERRRAAEVEDLVLLSHWADLHAADPQTWTRWCARLVRRGPVGPGRR